jgi:hypothetical protein
LNKPKSGLDFPAGLVESATRSWYQSANPTGSPAPIARNMSLQRIALSLAVTLCLAVAPAHDKVAFKFIAEPGTPQHAIVGFVLAGSLWSDVLANDITVNIQIGFSSLGPGTIAEAGSEFGEWSYPEVTAALQAQRTSSDDYSAHASLQPGATFNRLINHTSNNPNGPNSEVPYVDSMDRVGLTTANAKALGLQKPSTELDATIRFSSDLSFDFNHGPIIAPGQLDFVGAAAHEIGHVLGFVSGVDDIDTLGGQFPGENFSSNLIDLFRYSQESLAAGPGYTDYTADNRLKYFSTDGGSSLVGAFSNGLVFGDGRQASHWKDFQGIGIMDPTANFGERLEISYTDLRAFDVIGFTLVPEPGIIALLGLGVLGVVIRRWVCVQTKR